MIRGIRFLVADENLKLRKGTVAQLQEIGACDTLEAAGEAEAVAMLQRGPVDFAIVSWPASGRMGPQLVQRLRTETQLRRLHILLAIAESRRDIPAMTAAAGANDYILRPFSADALEKKIVRIATLARMLAHPAADMVVPPVAARPAPAAGQSAQIS